MYKSDFNRGRPTGRQSILPIAPKPGKESYQTHISARNRSPLSTGNTFGVCLPRGFFDVSDSAPDQGLHHHVSDHRLGRSVFVQYGVLRPSADSSLLTSPRQAEWDMFLLDWVNFAPVPHGRKRMLKTLQFSRIRAP